MLPNEYFFYLYRKARKSINMNLFPYENTTIDSPLRKEEIKQVIQHHIAWTTEFGLTFTKGSPFEYEGHINNDTFKVRRILKSGINSFIPIASATIMENENGSKIAIKLSLHKTVIILGIVITLISALTLFASPPPIQNKLDEAFLIEQALNGTLDEAMYKINQQSPPQKNINWIALFCIIMPYLVSTLYFNYEAHIIKSKLNALLRANHHK